MLTRSEFDTWFDDYRRRFPAVNDYLARQPTREFVLDTWHQSTSAFDVDILRAVTAGILTGDFEPVANVQLGQFGSEIRKLCRQVLDARREKQHREEWQYPKGRPYVPLFSGSMVGMFRAGEAVRQLLGDVACDLPHCDDVHWDHPTCSAFCAAIILADDHSAYEDEACRTKLAEHGLTWEQVQEVASHIQRPVVMEAYDGEV